jgi:hypothetical protein
MTGGFGPSRDLRKISIGGAQVLHIRTRPSDS